MKIKDVKINKIQTNGEIHGMNQKVVRLRKHNQLKKKKKMTGQISKKVTDRKFCQ